MSSTPRDSPPQPPSSTRGGVCFRGLPPRHLASRGGEPGPSRSFTSRKPRRTGVGPCRWRSHAACLNSWMTAWCSGIRSASSASNSEMCFSGICRWPYNQLRTVARFRPTSRASARFGQSGESNRAARRSRVAGMQHLFVAAVIIPQNPLLVGRFRSF